MEASGQDSRLYLMFPDQLGHDLGLTEIIGDDHAQARPHFLQPFPQLIERQP